MKRAHSRQHTADRKILTAVALIVVGVAAGCGGRVASEEPKASSMKPAAAPVEPRGAESRATPIADRGSRGIEQPVEAQLIVEHEAIQPGGTTRVGVLFRMPEGWHIYAEDAGDAGLPTKITWNGDPRLSFGPLQWPVPDEFTEAGTIHTRGYVGRVVLASQVKADSSIVVGQSLAVRADVRWLACKEICIPGSATLETALPVVAYPPGPSDSGALFNPPDTGGGA